MEFQKRPELHLGAFKWCLALSRPAWTRTTHTHTHTNLWSHKTWGEFLLDVWKETWQSVFLTLTRLALVLLLSSSGMGRNTAKATQFAKMVNRMIISKALHRGSQGRNEKNTGNWQDITVNLSVFIRSRLLLEKQQHEPHLYISEWSSQQTWTTCNLACCATSFSPVGGGGIMNSPVSSASCLLVMPGDSCTAQE